MKIRKLFTTRNLVGFGIAATLVGAYNNCSNTKFSPSDISDKVTDFDVPTVVRNCQELAAKGGLQTLNQTVKFEDTRVETGRGQICEFGVGDNLSVEEGNLRARYEQSQKLNLPANAVICDVQMNAGVQEFKYDDVFYLTFNNRVVASNLKSSLASRLDAETIKVGNSNLSLFKYDWMRVRTAPFDSTVIEDYCLGSDEGLSTCKWPQTEHTGEISFDFDPVILVNLGARSNATNQKFGFVVVGDNDPGIDCYHQKLEFNMNVQYYIQ